MFPGHRDEGAHRPGAAEVLVRTDHKSLDPICDGAKCIAIAFREFPRPASVFEILKEEEIGGLCWHRIFSYRGGLGDGAAGERGASGDYGTPVHETHFIVSLAECGSFLWRSVLRGKRPTHQEPAQWREESMISSLSARD